MTAQVTVNKIRTTFLKLLFPSLIRKSSLIFKNKIFKILKKNRRYNWKTVPREPFLKCERYHIWRELNFFMGNRLGSDSHILFTTCLAPLSKEEFLSPFTECLEIRCFIKQPKTKWWQESPQPRNWSQSFHFP